MRSSLTDSTFFFFKGFPKGQCESFRSNSVDKLLTSSSYVWSVKSHTEQLMLVVWYKQWQVGRGCLKKYPWGFPESHQTFPRGLGLTLTYSCFTPVKSDSVNSRHHWSNPKIWTYMWWIYPLHELGPGAGRWWWGGKTALLQLVFSRAGWLITVCTMHIDNFRRKNAAANCKWDSRVHLINTKRWSVVSAPSWQYWMYYY